MLEVKYKQKDECYVVLGVHPNNPNLTGDLDTRKRHYSYGVAKTESTLCNLLVALPIEDHEVVPPNKMCRSCEDRFKEMRQEAREAARIEEKTTPPNGSGYSFTINTDASRDPETGISGWACWIKSSDFLIKESGQMDGSTPTSSVAEAHALSEALELVDLLIDTQPYIDYLRSKKKVLLHINTDSMWVIRGLLREIENSKYQPVLEHLDELTEQYKISPKHVKAHSGLGDARSWVNDWCDKQARAQMRARLERFHAKE